MIQTLLQLNENDFEKENILNILNSNPLTPVDMSKFARFDGQNYTRNLLCKNKNFELLLLCWEPGQSTYIHDHADQKCWMTVLDGIITADNFEYLAPEDFNGNLKKTSTQSFKPGQACYIDDDISLHLLRNPIKNNQRTMTLHLYSKPFSSCTIYDLEKKQASKLELKYHSMQGRSQNCWAHEVSVL